MAKTTKTTTTTTTPSKTATKVTKASAPVVAAATTSTAVVDTVSVPTEDVAAVPTEAISTVFDQFSGFMSKLQGISAQMSSLRTEFRGIERQVTRELKAAAKVSQKRKRKAGNRAPSGFVKPTLISNELAGFLARQAKTDLSVLAAIDRLQRSEITMIWNSKLSKDGDINDQYRLAWESTKAKASLLMLTGGGQVKRVTPEELGRIQEIPLK